MEETPLRNFAVEHFSLPEFLEICKHGSNNTSLLCNVIADRYEKYANLNVIGLKFFSNDVLVFMRWNA